MMPKTLRTFRPPGWFILAATDVGLVRKRQEDAWSVLPGARFADQTVDVCAVFDGLGGEPRGDLASQAANENLARVLSESQHADDVLPALDRLVDQTGGMTTAAIGVFPRARPNHGMVLTAGDSAAYVCHPGGRPVLVIAKDRSGGAVSSCLGGGLLTANAAPVQVVRGVTFAFCSDGVDDVAGLGALGKALAAPTEGLEGAVRSLYEEIEARGAPDNATLVIARRE